jgi:hypothetical protein
MAFGWMRMRNEPSVADPIQALDSVHAEVSNAQRRLFELIVEVDRSEAWRDAGARDLAHWLSMRYGISQWKVTRWIASAHALDRLPQIDVAFSSGELGIDKVVELTRFATPETEAGLIRWADRVSSGAIRHRGDLLARRVLEEIQDAHATRRVGWWFFDDGRRFGLEAELPAADGAVVAKALERLAETLPIMPGEEGSCYAEARRADALVAICSMRIGSDPDPDRATVVVHAQTTTLDDHGTPSGGAPIPGGCEIEHGPVLHPETVRRLACTARIQTVLEDRSGTAIGVGRMRREPPAFMMRQLRYRDRECVFPGCGDRRFAHAHHVRWWSRGGRTDLDNLVLVCTFHHRLVHELGWRLQRRPGGKVWWFRPDGTRHRSGPAPPISEDSPTTQASGGQQLLRAPPAHAATP